MTDTLNDLEEVIVNETLAKKIANGVQLTQDDITWENYSKPLKIVHLDRLIAIIEKKGREIKYNYCCVFNY